MNKDSAQRQIAEALLWNTSSAAYKRLEAEARSSKQTVREVAFRIAGNMLNSLVTRKPGGYVDTLF